VDEALVSELESALADAGALLVRAQKYRRGAGPEGDALAREALALGDAARRLHHRGTLDDGATHELLAQARTVADQLRALIAAVRADPGYAAAVAAHAARDAPTLVRLLPAIFAGIEPTPPVASLHAPVAWLHRSRLRPPAEVANEIVAAREKGIPAEGDDLSPGADADLPAVVLTADLPPGEPVVLRLEAGTVRGPLHRLVESDERLVHVPRLAVAATAVIAERLALDEQLRVEIEAADWTRFRAALVGTLAAAGVPVLPA
jgi:hypothetical protein